MSATSASHLRTLVEKEASAIEKRCLRERHAKLEQAKAADETAQLRLTESRRRRAAAEDHLEKMSPGSWVNWVKGIGLAGGAATCFAAEVALTWVVLPFLLNIPHFSFLGVMLGLGPPTALLVLELAIGRLIEDPWQASRARIESSSPRRWCLPTCVMATFVGIVALGNLQTVMLLAKAREEGMTVRRLLTRSDEFTASVDRTVVRQAVVAVSLMVTIDGALFLLLATSELQKASTRTAAAWSAGRWRRRQFKHETDRCRKAAALATAQRDWEQGPDQAQALAARFREQLLLELDRLLRRPRAKSTALQVVNDVLCGARPIASLPDGANGRAVRADHDACGTT